MGASRPANRSCSVRPRSRPDCAMHHGSQISPPEIQILVAMPKILHIFKFSKRLFCILFGTSLGMGCENHCSGVSGTRRALRGSQGAPGQPKASDSQLRDVYLSAALAGCVGKAMAETPRWPAGREARRVRDRLSA